MLSGILAFRVLYSSLGFVASDALCGQNSLAITSRHAPKRKQCSRDESTGKPEYTFLLALSTERGTGPF